MDDSPGLRVEQIAAGAWRVSFACQADDPLPMLLGFVEKHSAGYEVMQLGVTFGWATFDTLNHALTQMLQTATETLAERSDGELRWIS